MLTNMYIFGGMLDELSFASFRACCRSLKIRSQKDFIENFVRSFILRIIVETYSDNFKLNSYPILVDSLIVFLGSRFLNSLNADVPTAITFSKFNFNPFIIWTVIHFPFVSKPSCPRLQLLFCSCESTNLKNCHARTNKNDSHLTLRLYFNNLLLSIARLY